jgi:hypothetical protein
MPPEILPTSTKEYNINKNLKTLAPTLDRPMPGLVYKISYKRGKTASGSAFGTPGSRRY